MEKESQVDTIKNLNEELDLLREQLAALQLSELKYKNLFNAYNNAVFIINYDGNFIEVNQVACNRYGYSDEEFQTKSLKDIFVDFTESDFRSRINEVQGTGISVFNSDHITRDKSIIPTEITAKPFNYLDNPSILVIAKDITYLKNRDTELEREKEFLHALLDNIPDTIYFKDPESRFTKINYAQAKLLGINDPENAIGKTDYDFFSKHHADKAYADERQIVRTKKPMIAQAEKPSHADGRFRWVTSTKVPLLDSQKNVIGIVGISRDISDIKIAEEKILEYTKELQYLNASKDKFFSIIAHDLKNPFVSLLGFAEILLEDYNELTDEERNEYISNILEVSKSSHQLLDNLLQWSRAQTGRIEYCPMELDVCQIVNECIQLLKSPARKKGIQLISNVPEGSMVFADRDMLLTIVRNLATNAIKFTTNNDKVFIATKQYDSDNTEVMVTDTGLGMDDETLSKLFRIDVHHSTKGTCDEIGTGLGLILCKEFVEKNGG